MSKYQVCKYCDHDVFFMIYENVTVSYNTKMVINGRTGTRDIRQHSNDEAIYYTDPSQIKVRCGMCGTEADVKVKSEKEFYHWYRNP